jgi:hypothetical protein
MVGDFGKKDIHKNQVTLAKELLIFCQQVLFTIY